MTNKNQQWIAQWEAYRSKGRARGIAIPAVSFFVLYVIVMVVMSLFFNFSEPLTSSFRAGDFTTTAVVALLYVLGGAGFGWINWAVSEKRYKRLTEESRD